jgi:hypothetical protein
MDRREGSRMKEILDSISICLNGISIITLAVVLYRVQKELREIRYQNTRIENQQRMLDRLTNFRYQQDYSEIDLTNENLLDTPFLKR